jgi:hypothetical protein
MSVSVHGSHHCLVVCVLDEVLQDMVYESVAVGTRKNYRPAEPLWREFLRVNEFQNVFMAGLTNQQKAKCLALFVVFLREKERSIGTIMAGLRQFFVANFQPIDAFNDNLVSAVRTTCLPKGRETAIAKEANQKLPFSVDMLKALRISHWCPTPRSTTQMMQYLGAAICLNLVLRVSNVALCNTSNHTLRTDDVMLEVGDPPVSVPSHALSSLPTIGVISSVIFFIRTSKCQSGKTQFKQFGPTDDLNAQFVRDIADWCLIARFKKGDVFCSRYEGGLQKHLTTHLVSKCLKDTAESFNLDPSKFSSHSLRAAGATTLASGGVSSEQIATAGGWADSSGAMQLYLHGSMAQPTPFSVASSLPVVHLGDVRRMDSLGMTVQTAQRKKNRLVK